MLKENWTYKKFSEVFNLQMGKTPSRDNLAYWGGNNVWVSIADLKDKYIESSKEHITDIAVSESGINKVPQGTAIMSFKLTIGRSAITKCDLFTNEAIMSFEPKEKNILAADYIYYYLKGCKWTGANKAVMGQTLNKKTISENIFAYPSIETQSRIVSELDLLQSIIDKQKAQLKELDNLAQAVFYDMFGDPVENEKGWEVKPLQEICLRITDGSHFSPKEDENGIYPMLTVKDMDANGFNYDRCKYISEKDYTLLVANGCKPLANDVLVAKDGSYLKTAFVQKEEKEQVILSSIAILTPNNKIVSPEYLAFFFKLPETKNIVERNYLTGTAIKRVILKGFKVIKISIPPLHLQQSFAAKIESIEKQKTAIGKSIEEAQKLFDYMMDKYFG